MRRRPFQSSIEQQWSLMRTSQHHIDRSYTVQSTARTSSLEDPKSSLALVSNRSTARTLLPEDPQSSLTLVCSACQAGPFSHEGFRQAVKSSLSDSTTGYCYTTTWNKISLSIENEACSWCHFVRRTRDGLPTDKFPPADEDVEIRFMVPVESWKGVRIYLNGHFVDSIISADPGDRAAEETGTNVPKQPRVDYASVLELIKQCNHHEHCPIIEETYLPTRVIDCSDPSKPRLVDTQRKIRSHYCTLSYVWGGNQAQKTTTSNIETYIREGINVPLPQTIADAISVTNKLSIRYLWVDALCIIQDSSEDMQKELSVMADIYRNAYLMISARDTFRADQGFLPYDLAPTVLPFHFADKSISPGRMILWYLMKWNNDGLLEPLLQRGWCLQESFLSARILEFGADRAHRFHVGYRCRSFRESTIGSPYPFTLPTDGPILFPTNKNHDSTTTSGKVEHTVLWNSWRDTVADYSSRKITIPSDKFNALASIVKLFQSISKDQYIAGLWQRTLLYDLLWIVIPQQDPTYYRQLPECLLRPLDYRAPSWSWASIDRRVYLYQPDLNCAATYEAEILTWEVTPKFDTNPFGEITDARLTIKAKMHLLSCGGREGDIVFDCLEGTEEGPQMDFYLLILRAGREQERILGFGQSNEIQGLIVLPIYGKTEQYRRVARWSLEYDMLSLPGWFYAMPSKTVTLI